MSLECTPESDNQKVHLRLVLATPETPLHGFVSLLMFIGGRHDFLSASLIACDGGALLASS